MTIEIENWEPPRLPVNTAQTRLGLFLLLPFFRIGAPRSPRLIPSSFQQGKKEEKEEEKRRKIGLNSGERRMQCAIIITHDACNPSRRRCSHADTLSAGSTDLSPSPFSLLRAHITDPLAKMRYPIPAVMIDIVCRGEKRRREPLARVT